MTEKKEVDEPRISLLDKLTQYKEEKSVVEIITEDRTTTGILSAIGIDYLGVISSVEQTVKNIAVGQDGVEEPTENIIVIELEVLLKLEDIRAVSKVLKSVTK